MKGRRGVKLTALTLAAGMMLTATPMAELDVRAEGTDTSTVTATDQYENEMLTKNYTKVSAGFSAKNYKGEDLVIPAADAVSPGADITSDTRDYAAASEVVALKLYDNVTFTVEVPETALYFVGLDYLSYDESVLPIGLSMTVDGEFPFYECRNLEFETTWVGKGEKSFDRYDNEIVTVPDKLIQWERKFISDGSYRRSRPLAMELTAGTHEFSMTVLEGQFLLGSIVLSAPEEIATYAGSEAASGSEFIEIQAEEFDYRNDSAIHAVVEYDSSLTPYEVTDTVLNTVDSDSFKDAGQKITYNFDVKTAGYYNIGMNYRQSDKNDFPVFLDVEVDGKIPNTAFRQYKMDYTNKYKTTTLADAEGNYLSVYLEPGQHTISFTITIDPLLQIMEGLDVIMSEVNDLSLEITKVAGTNKDKYRDLKLSRYIPGIEETMFGYAQQLYDLQETVRQYVEGEEQIAVLSSMSVGILLSARVIP